MKRTTNYDLPTWEKDDFIRMQDFNDLTGKLDAALKSGADATAEKADGTATQQALSSLQSSIGTTGENCRIVYGSYVGDGRVGEDKPVTLSFDFYPAAVLVAGNPGGLPTVFIHGCTSAQSANRYNMLVSWTDNSVSWRYNASSGYDVNNGSGETYYYIALGYEL